MKRRDFSRWIAALFGAAALPTPGQVVPPRQVTLTFTIHGHILDDQRFADSVIVPALRSVIDARKG